MIEIDRPYGFIQIPTEGFLIALGFKVGDVITVTSDTTYQVERPA